MLISYKNNANFVNQPWKKLHNLEISFKRSRICINCNKLSHISSSITEKMYIFKMTCVGGGGKKHHALMIVNYKKIFIIAKFIFCWVAMICMVSGMHAVCLVWSSVICINHPLYKNFNNSNLCCSPKNFFFHNLYVWEGEKKRKY